MTNDQSDIQGLRSDIQNLRSDIQDLLDQLFEDDDDDEDDEDEEDDDEEDDDDNHRYADRILWPRPHPASPRGRGRRTAAGEGTAKPDAATDDSPLVLSRSKDEAGGGARRFRATGGTHPLSPLLGERPPHSGG